MDLNKLKDLQDSQADFELPFALSDLYELDGSVFINGKVVIPVENVSYEYDKSIDIVIKNESGSDIGVLLLVKNEEKDILLLSEYQFVSLLIEANDHSEIALTKYIFKNDYVVIDQNYFNDYKLRYKRSAPIWGKFNHSYSGLIITPAHAKVIPFITASNYDGFNHNFYYESAIRGLQQLSPFERYLKYYHLLELNFDYDVIKRVQSLDINTDSHKIGKLLKEYEAKEFPRLTYLFDTYCTNISPIVDKLNLVSSFLPIANDILFVFGKKDSNPFENFAQFSTLATSPGGFSHSNFTLHFKPGMALDVYQKFIGKLTMYIIYRMRNSIAHNKIGEYLLVNVNQSFITEFGELLLLDVLKQVFKN